MKRFVVLALSTALVVGLIGTAEAGKKKKKPTVTQVDQQMFLTQTACEVEARAISTVDGGGDDTCWYVRAGIVYEAIPADAPAPAGADPWQTWPATDGVPLTLDAGKPITGEIYTAGFCPLVGLCTISGGSVTVTVVLVGESGGEEKTIGEFVDEFVAAPGAAPHGTMVEITPDAALNGVEFTSLTLKTKIGGASAGQGVYKVTDPNSFITIPALVTN